MYQMTSQIKYAHVADCKQDNLIDMLMLQDATCCIKITFVFAYLIRICKLRHISKCFLDSNKKKNIHYASFLSYTCLQHFLGYIKAKLLNLGISKFSCRELKHRQFQIDLYTRVVSKFHTQNTIPKVRSVPFHATAKHITSFNFLCFLLTEKLYLSSLFWYNPRVFCFLFSSRTELQRRFFLR